MMVGSVEGVGVIGGRLADFFSLGPVPVNVRTRSHSQGIPRCFRTRSREPKWAVIVSRKSILLNI